jgi:hypothetical protein
MKRKLVGIALLSILTVGCAPKLFVSNELGNAKLEVYPDSTRNLIITGIGIMNRDGNSRIEIENKAKDNNLKIKKEAIGKLSNQQDDKILKCIEQIYLKNAGLHYMSDGTIEARDTISNSEINSIQKCIKE